MKLDFFTKHHTSTSRNYFERMNENKHVHMATASNFSKDYWDGDRACGYGGYHYDGRWEPLAKKLIEYYSLTNNSIIAELGCGKGFLLYELKKLLPNLEVHGFDVSHYAIENSKAEINVGFLDLEDKSSLSIYKDDYFDLTISLMTLHNLSLSSLELSLSQISRISKNSYITVESYRNWKELTNLQCWALTCKSFFSPQDWEYLFSKNKYEGDYEFLFFE